MAERPILFSGPMVKAILAGRKTQTRRIVKPQPSGIDLMCYDAHAGKWFGWVEARERVAGPAIRCPYGQPCDELLFLTTWASAKEFDSKKPSQLPASAPLWSLFDGEDKPAWCGKSRPGRFMPAFLRGRMPRGIVRYVRLQRLQEISAKDIIDEGAVDRPHEVEGLGKCPVSAFDGKVYVDLRSLWQSGWDSINAKRARWSSNPFVWAITFERKEARQA